MSSRHVVPLSAAFCSAIRGGRRRCQRNNPGYVKPMGGCDRKRGKGRKRGTPQLFYSRSTLLSAPPSPSESFCFLLPSLLLRSVSSALGSVQRAGSHLTHWPHTTLLQPPTKVRLVVSWEFTYIPHLFHTFSPHEDTDRKMERYCITW